MATISDPWPKKSLPNGHPADGMLLEVDVGDGAQMTILDPRSFADGGLVHALTWGAAEDVKYAAASIACSLDYLLSDEITATEAIQRLREMRRVRAKAASLARVNPRVRTTP